MTTTTMKYFPRQGILSSNPPNGPQFVSVHDLHVGPKLAEWNHDPTPHGHFKSGIFLARCPERGGDCFLWDYEWVSRNAASRSGQCLLSWQQGVNKLAGIGYGVIAAMSPEEILTTVKP